MFCRAEIFILVKSNFEFFHGLVSVQFSCSVMSDSLWPHGLQHTRLPCPSPTPRACSNSCPSSQWWHPPISSSNILFSYCLQSFLASGFFPMSQFSAWGGQSIGASASASVLPMNTQDWFSAFSCVLTKTRITRWKKKCSRDILCVCVLSCFRRVRLCDPMDCSPPGSPVHGILQARILEWVAIFSSSGSSQYRDQTHVLFPVYNSKSLFKMQ